MPQSSLQASSVSKSYRSFILLLLTLIYAFNFIDRQIIGIVSPYIQEDLGLTNSQLGYLKGIFFALFYTLIGIPVAWLADRYNRVNIISSAVVIWSGFTALTAMATGFSSIGVARMGVGIGEAGGSPPSHSIISDLYPKEERAKALAIWSLGIPIGLGFAYFIAGITLANPESGIDWRRLLIGLGLTGIVLGILTRIIVREPKRGAQENVQRSISTPPAKPSFKHSLATLLKIPSWWFMCLGISCASFTGYGVQTWQIDYLKPFDESLAEPMGMQKIFIILALLNTIIYGTGTYIGGLLTQKLAKKSVSYYGRVPAISLLCSMPIIITAFWAPSTSLHLIFTGGYLFFSGMYLGPTFAIAQTLAPINMRAMSTAIFFLILNLIALGFGPTAVGLISDALKDVGYEQIGALRISISCIAFGIILSAINFFMASKTLPRDWDMAQKRNDKRNDRG